jgi:hypothetical protein
MPFSSRWCLCGAAAVLVFAQNAQAADVVAAQEYDKYIDKHRTVQALDSSLFGEQISARDGSVSFKMVDGELAGNGPPLQIVRSFQPRENNRFFDGSGESVAGWVLEIPRMKTIVNYSVNTQSNSPYGWQVPGADKNARCTNFGPPGPVVLSPTYRYWDDHEWWSGYQLVDLSGNEHEVLRVSDPAMWSAGFRAMTSSNWRISCLAGPVAGGVGEGFLATSPDGTKYWFDRLVYTTADTMTKAIESTPMSISGTSTQTMSTQSQVTTLAPAQDLITRKHAMLLVSRVEDRFGNSLTYQYDQDTGVFTGISASDGRYLTIATVNGNKEILLGGTWPTGVASPPRKWVYSLVSGVGTVTLPDGSAWTYNFTPLTTMSTTLASAGAGSCIIPNNTVTGTAQATATAPSGVTGTFTLTAKRFGRSYVPYDCFDPNGDGDGHAMFPPTYIKYALTQRSFTGPGLATQTWSYAYSAPYASYSNTCSGGCTAEVWSDVTDPEGTRQRSVFSNRYDETENQLLREETYNASNVLMRKVTHQYATFPAMSATTPYPWPKFIGEDMQMRTNKARSERWAPAKKHQTEQQGRLFTWEVDATCGTGSSSLCFDALARPTKVTKSSTGP